MRSKSNKIGRNDPCPCGSGKKYKRCCLLTDSRRELSSGHVSNEFPEEIVRWSQEITRNKVLWEKRYGHVRPIIHTDLEDKKIVAVAGELYLTDSHDTFPDFLISHLITKLGSDWWQRELLKPISEKHQILKWYDSLCNFLRFREKHGADPSSFPLEGTFASFMLLAYDIYILRHHGLLQSQVIGRMKIRDQFQGARYELFVAATFVRAGFDIDYEIESDLSKKHPEFKATHRRTRQEISVEAKSRHRPGVLDFSGESEPDRQVKIGINGLLKNALKKPTHYPYVIFIDLNLPPTFENLYETPWFKEIQETVNRLGGSLEGKAHFNLLVLTNYPHHYGKEGKPNPPMLVIPKSPRILFGSPEVIQEIEKAVLQYGNIPRDFPPE